MSQIKAQLWIYVSFFLTVNMVFAASHERQAPSRERIKYRKSSKVVTPSPVHNHTPQRVAGEVKGTAWVDWSSIVSFIETQVPELKDRKGLKIHLLVNGRRFQSFDWGVTSALIKEKESQQADYYIEVERNGEVFYRSDFFLKESQNGQTIQYQFGNYEGEQFKFLFSSFLKKQGLDANLSQVAVQLSYKKLVWVLNPYCREEIRKFVENASEGVDIQVEASTLGDPEKIVVVDISNQKKIEATQEDIFLKVDAAFNGNSFFWDDMLVSLATVSHHPWLAASTIKFWLVVQKLNFGAIPREVRKSNLVNLWFDTIIRPGEEKRPHLAYSNPYLMDWVMDELVRFDNSKENIELMRQVTISMIDYIDWLEKNRAVRDPQKKIIGFNGSALGSGADNRSGERGNKNEPIAYQSAMVDILGQTIGMLHKISEFNDIYDRHHPEASMSERKKRWTESANAKAKAEDYTRALNTFYWNEEQGFFFDLVPAGNGLLRQDTDYYPVTAFWALFGAKLSDRQVERFIEKQMGSDGFGGEVMIPANRYDKAFEEGVKAHYQPHEDGFWAEDGYWDKWAVWPSMTAVAAEAFFRQKKYALSFEITIKMLRLMAKVSNQVAQSLHPTVFEFYGSVFKKKKGQPQYVGPRPGQHSHHKVRFDFTGWGKIPPIYMFLKYGIGIHPSEEGGLVWNLMIPLEIGESIGLEHMPFRGQIIRSLTLTKVSDGQYEIRREGSLEEIPVTLNVLVDENSVIQSKILATSGAQIFIGEKSTLNVSSDGLESQSPSL